jgi:hypothetical protein
MTWICRDCAEGRHFHWTSDGGMTELCAALTAEVETLKRDLAEARADGERVRTAVEQALGRFNRYDAYQGFAIVAEITAALKKEQG